MHKCPKDISPDCSGHEGWQKFTDCLTEAFYYADSDGTVGDTDGFGWYVSLFIQDTAETIDAAYDGASVTIPAGTYCLIRTNDQGHVYRDDYETAEEAQKAFDAWDSDYSDWLDAEDVRELAITSSTGRVGR